MHNQDRSLRVIGRFIRRLYDWTVSWAHRPGATVALFVLAFIESSVFPIPPDVLLIALCIGAPKRSFLFSSICLCGSVLGGLLGYVIGLWGYEFIGKKIVEFYRAEAIVEKVKIWYQIYGWWGILGAAITPIPYKIFTIASGLFEYPIWQFITASILGRGMRFFAVGGLIWIFGPKIKTFIERYFEWVAWSFFILLILGFIVLKFIKV